MPAEHAAGSAEPGQSPRRSRRPTRRGLGRDDQGAVTAELAVALPAVVLVLAALLVVVVAGVAQVRVVDAARAGARAASAGETDGRVQEIVAQTAGTSAAVTVDGDGTWVTVTVRSSVTGGWFSGPLAVSASASARLEAASGTP